MPEAGASHAALRGHDRGGLLFHLGLLTALAVPLYAFMPEAGGVHNWQEATRALVAREMQRDGAFIVPTVFGEPYLNKPPLMYWATIAIASLRGHVVTLADARLAAALGAYAGVMTTYLVGRPLYRRLTPYVDDAPRFALWSALLLATGVLFTRSARIAEIDILYSAPVMLAVGCSLLAWRSVEAGVGAFSRVGLIALACVGAALAGLAKGPPPLAALLLGSVLAPAIVAARRPPLRPAPGLVKASMSIAGAALLLALGLLAPEDDRSWLGLVVLVALGAVLGLWLADLVRPAALRHVWLPLRKTHPWLVAAGGITPLLLWLHAASGAIGADAVADTVDQQAAHNLVLVAPNAASRNIGYATYAVGAASPLALFALFRIAKDRPRLPFLTASLAVWLVLGFALFSLFGKGVARYMTPMWPPAAMLAAATLLDLTRAHRRLAPALTTAAAVAVAALFVGQTVWYSVGRTMSSDPTDPDAVHERILAEGVEPVGLAFINDDLREVEFLLDHPVAAFDLEDDRDAASAALFARLEADGTLTVVAIDPAARADLERFAGATRVSAAPLNPAADLPVLFRLALPSGER